MRYVITLQVVLRESYLLLCYKIITGEKHLSGVKSPSCDMIPQCLVFLEPVPTLTGALRSSYRDTNCNHHQYESNQSQISVSSCRLPTTAQIIVCFAEISCSQLLPKEGIQAERVEVSLESSTQYCIFSSQLSSSKPVKTKGVNTFKVSNQGRTRRLYEMGRKAQSWYVNGVQNQAKRTAAPC